MPCIKCEDGNWRWGESGECKYDSLASCEADNVDYSAEIEYDYKLNFTFNKAQQREVRAALSNTFGFGGHNTSVIFKKFQS